MLSKPQATKKFILNGSSTQAIKDHSGTLEICEGMIELPLGIIASLGFLCQAVRLESQCNPSHPIEREYERGYVHRSARYPAGLRCAHACAPLCPLIPEISDAVRWRGDDREKPLFPQLETLPLFLLIAVLVIDPV